MVELNLSTIPQGQGVKRTCKRKKKPTFLPLLKICNGQYSLKRYDTPNFFELERNCIFAGTFKRNFSRHGVPIRFYQISVFGGIHQKPEPH